MDLTKDALLFIQGTNAPVEVNDGDRRWTDKKLYPIAADNPPFFEASTLSGFLRLIASKIYNLDESQSVIYISSFNKVELFSRIADTWGRRQKFAEASPVETKAFSFASWLDHETFIIGLQSLFVSTPDLVNLVKLASNLTDSAVQTSLDDGISQQLSVKRGVVLAGTEIAKQRVLLKPFRTFPEIEQPTSEFVFRARGGGENSKPSLALFEADGGAWKLDAIREIAAWFNGKTTIPVIS